MKEYSIAGVCKNRALEFNKARGVGEHASNSRKMEGGFSLSPPRFPIPRAPHHSSASEQAKRIRINTNLFLVQHGVELRPRLRHSQVGLEFLLGSVKIETNLPHYIT